MTCPETTRQSERLRGNLPLKTDKFGNVLLGTLDFDFDTMMDKIDNFHINPEEADILPKIEYKELTSFGWIETAKSQMSKILNLRAFYGVDSLHEIPLRQQVAFRQVKVTNINQYSLAAWLRKGELDSASLKLPAYSKDKLLDAIHVIRKISYEMPDDFFNKTAYVLRDAGVGLIAVKTPKNTAVNGAVRKNNGMIIIQMSIYGRKAATMWFTLFHEIGHILMHNIENQGFISLDSAEKTPEENEANNFARETLLDRDTFDRFAARKHFTLANVEKFSKEVEVHPSIIMERLEHENLVPFNKFAKHHLKVT